MSTETRRVINQEVSVWALNAQGEEMQPSIIDDGYVIDSLDLGHMENNGGLLGMQQSMDNVYVFDSLELGHGYGMGNNGRVLGMQRSIMDGVYVFDSVDFGDNNNNVEDNVGVSGVEPATRVSIENLERVTIDGSEYSSVTDSDSMPVCSICLGVLSIGLKAIRMPNPCFHVFHQDCIIRWLNICNTCPLCRRSI